MNVFSAHSKQQLASCHPDLILLANEVLKIIDFRVLEGYRSNERQLLLYEQGLSKKLPGTSKHNIQPSLAYDCVPWPLDWNDRLRFYYFAGVMVATAHMLGIELRWGGDWDRDHDLHDQNFYDLAHYELTF